MSNIVKSGYHFGDPIEPDVTPSGSRSPLVLLIENFAADREALTRLLVEDFAVIPISDCYDVVEQHYFKDWDDNPHSIPSVVLIGFSPCYAGFEDGLRFIKALRQKYPPVRFIVAMTTFEPDPEREKQLRKAGTDEVFRKMGNLPSICAEVTGWVKGETNGLYLYA